MSLTRINNANAFTGTIPATNFANSTLDNITSLPNAPLGDMVLVSSATASSSASIEFSLGSYKEYKFFFVNIHPDTDTKLLEMNLSTDGGSTYNVTKTSTAFTAYHNEAGSTSFLGYTTGTDLAQSTADQRLSGNTGTDNDQSLCGVFQIFNPSSTTYVKHFISTTHVYEADNMSQSVFVAGYGNTTSAINSIKFEMNGGNIDDGKILMFGIN